MRRASSRWKASSRRRTSLWWTGWTIIRLIVWLSAMISRWKKGGASRLSSSGHTSLFCRGLSQMSKKFIHLSPRMMSWFPVLRIQKGMSTCRLPSTVKFRIKAWVIVLFYSPSNARTNISWGSRVTLTFRNLAALMVKEEFIKAKLFTPILTSIEVLILYLLRDIIHRIVKYFPLIKRLKLIFFILIPYPRAESFPRALLFPAPNRTRRALPR